MIKKIFLSAVVIVSVGIGAYLISTHSKEKTKGPESSQEAPANSRPAEAVSPTAVVQSEAPASSGVVSSQEKSESAVWANFQHKAELERYLALNKKVLMAADEERAKKELLEDRAFIQSLQPLLLVEASKETIPLQNAALDYLFEALKSGAQEDVAAVLKAVVADSTIESETHSMDSRKALAGVKAEVLLNWSSLDPSAEAQIEDSLPGPVSQKIWAHVKQHQDNNLAESASLQARK